MNAGMDLTLQDDRLTQLPYVAKTLRRVEASDGDMVLPILKDIQVMGIGRIFRENISKNFVRV